MAAFKPTFLIIKAGLGGFEPTVRRSTVYHTNQLYYSLIYLSFQIVMQFLTSIIRTCIAKPFMGEIVESNHYLSIHSAS